METATAPPPAAPSAKGSSSDDDLLDLKRLQLAKMNRLQGSETPEQVRAAWEQFETDRADAAAKAEEQRREQSRENMLKMLRASARQYGVTVADDADEQTIRRAVDRAKSEVETRRAEIQRQVAEDRRQERADQLFAAARCPIRHVENLYAADLSEHPKWLELRDLLAGQACYASGFLVALLGTRGVGKTQLAVSVLRRCCDRLMTARYVKALDLFRDFRGAYTPVRKGERGESEEDIIAGWVSPDVLVIDELHQRGETAFENNTLINLLDLRYDARKCTVLIANQTKAEFAAAMGDSVVSRIHETGDAFVCEWESFRKQGSWRQENGAEQRAPSGVPRSRRIDN